jgi:hypothetical protein
MSTAEEPRCPQCLCPRDEPLKWGGGTCLNPFHREPPEAADSESPPPA